MRNHRSFICAKMAYIFNPRDFLLFLYSTKRHLKNGYKMRNTIQLCAVLLFIMGSAFSQESKTLAEEGGTYLIGKSDDKYYEYIQFPRENFIRKKGGIPNYSALVGNTVEVVSIKNNKRGDIVATLQLASGKKFFHSHKYVKVLLQEAIEKGELLTLPNID